MYCVVLFNNVNMDELGIVLFNNINMDELGSVV